MVYVTLAVFVSAAVALVSSSVVQAPGNGNFELLILHNNDMHARFEQTSQLSGACTTADREAGKCYGGFPRVAHVVKEARKAAASGEGPPVLYLNAGDTYTGTAWFTIYKWKVAAEFLNALQPDAVSLGNHEFDNGVSGLTPFIANLTCPVLAANLILNRETSLQAQKNLMKSITLDIKGNKIGIIGYLTPDTKILATRNNVDYTNEEIAIRNEIAKLKKQNVKIFIALGHSGYLKDLDIAKIEDVDLVIGGHTNTFLWDGKTIDSEEADGPYPTLVKQASGKIVPVVQAYAYTKYLGKLHIFFNSSGDIINFNGTPILLDNSVPQDADILKIVQKYHEDVTKLTEVVVGKVSVILDGRSCRLKECNMGNMITDAMVHKYATEYVGEGWTDAPIAIMPGGGIRASIVHNDLPTNITKGDLLIVLPFDGNLVKLSINGSNIWKMLEHSVAGYLPLRPPGEFLQLSGLKVVYDFEKPSGMRVKTVSVRCGNCYIPTYSLLNRTEVYNILMPSFLSMGGCGFSLFIDLPSTALEYDELQSTIEYITNHRPLFPALEDRIVIHNGDKLSKSNATSKKLSFSCILFLLLINL